MHPPLFRPHPKCQDMITRLLQCHEENPIGKFTGACNDVKAEMDNCFRQEKEEKRAANLKKAREFENYERQMKELRQMKKNEGEKN